MADLTVSAYVTREGDTDLDIHDDVAFRIASRDLIAGSIAWRREEAQSPYLHGSVIVDAVKELAQGSLSLFVLGATHAALKSNLGTLLAAFEEDDYELHVTIEGEEYAWNCSQADYEVGLSTAYLSALIVPVSLSFPRQPIALVGPF